MKNTAVILTAVLLLCAALTGCADEGARESGTGDKPRAGVTINVYNWGEYISDGSDELMDINAEFTKRTGINVNYSTYANNEELYAKLIGGGVDYDIIIPSDYMAARLIKQGMLEKLDYANIPNSENIDPRFREDVSYDPLSEYTVPYAWGRVALIYNKTMVKKDITSWDILWDEEYKDQILMFDNPRDTFGIAQKLLGIPLNTTDSLDWLEAARLLAKQKPILQSYVNDQIFDKMVGNEAALGPYYAGDALTMVDENPDLGYVVPEEGTNLFVDVMAIPTCAKYKAEAEAYINFLCEDDVALANIEYIQYSSPQMYAEEEHKKYIFEKYGQEGLDLAYPTDLSKDEIFINLPDDINQLMDKLWVDIKTDTPIDDIGVRDGGSASVWKLVLVIGAFLLIWVAVVVYKRRKRRA